MPERWVLNASPVICLARAGLLDPYDQVTHLVIV